MLKRSEVKVAAAQMDMVVRVPSLRSKRGASGNKFRAKVLQRAPYIAGRLLALDMHAVLAVV